MINELLPLANGAGTGGDEKEDDMRRGCGEPAGLQLVGFQALPAVDRPGWMISPISNASNKKF